jgi:hypothetical protein
MFICEAMMIRGCLQVLTLTRISNPACTEVDSPSVTAEDCVEASVRQFMQFLKSVARNLSPCFPRCVDFDVVRAAFSAVKARVRGMVFLAAQDDGKQWNFKGYVNLVKIVLELIAAAEELGVAADALQDMEADLQVRSSLVLQFVGVFLLSSCHSLCL